MIAGSHSRSPFIDLRQQPSPSLSSFTSNLNVSFDSHSELSSCPTDLSSCCTTSTGADLEPELRFPDPAAAASKDQYGQLAATSSGWVAASALVRTPPHDGQNVRNGCILGVDRLSCVCRAAAVDYQCVARLAVESGGYARCMVGIGGDHGAAAAVFTTSVVPTRQLLQDNRPNYVIQNKPDYIVMLDLRSVLSFGPGINNSDGVESRSAELKAKTIKLHMSRRRFQTAAARIMSMKAFNHSSCCGCHRRNSSTKIWAIATADEGMVMTAEEDGGGRHRIRLWQQQQLMTESGTEEAYSCSYELTVAATLPSRWERLTGCLTGRYVEVRRHHRRLWAEHVDRITALAAWRRTKEGRLLLVSASWDRSLKLWLQRFPGSSFRCLQTVNRAHDDAINGATICQSSGALYTAASDGKVKAWALEVRRSRTTSLTPIHRICLLSEVGGTASVNALAVRPDGDVLFSGASDGNIRASQIDPISGEFVPPCNYSICLNQQQKLNGGGHCRMRSAVLCLAAPTEQLLCSGGADGAVRLWVRHRCGTGNLAEGLELFHCAAVLGGHNDYSPVRSLHAVSVDVPAAATSGGGGVGSELAAAVSVVSGSLDGRVTVWSVRWSPSCRARIGSSVILPENGFGGIKEYSPTGEATHLIHE